MQASGHIASMAHLLQYCALYSIASIPVELLSITPMDTWIAPAPLFQADLIRSRQPNWATVYSWIGDLCLVQGMSVHLVVLSKSLVFCIVELYYGSS